MALASGTRIGPHEITAQIGAGGMGEVYRARDTKLDRDVALKILPDAFTGDLERVARFQREAKVLASLNHPHIAAIYGLEEVNGVTALVLELVEGPTLADRIAQRPIPLDEALPLAKQIAEALEAAHERGIIHRDLKPANVKVTPDGVVKVLDFGLSKAIAPESSEADVASSPTMSLTAAASRVGLILGTAAYMSPEQARGKPVDKRTDIWAFGAVLFEMLAGSRPFPGDDIAQTLARVIDRDPEWNALPATLPPGVTTILHRCLEKDPRQRIRDIGDVRLALDGAFDAGGSPMAISAVPTAARAWWRRTLPVVAALVVGMVTAGLAVWTLSRPRAVAEVARFDVTPAEGLTILSNSPSVAISPDGRSIVYLTGGSNQGGSELHVRTLDRLDSTIVIGDGLVASPFFSPDSSQIGYYENREGRAPNLLKRVSIQGGPASTIAPIGTTPLRGATWGADGTVVFGDGNPESGLWRVPAAGGEPELLTTPGERTESGDHLWPQFLPKGSSVLFTIAGSSGEDSKIAALSLGTGEIRVLLAGGSYPRYSTTGHLLFGRDGALWAVGFDPDRLETLGDPVPVLEGVMTKGFIGATEVSLSANGTLLHVAGDATSSVARNLLWVDAEGRRDPVAIPPMSFSSVALSPDGTRAALGTAGRGGAENIWLSDLTRGTLQRLTQNAGNNRFPLWSPDGRRVAYWFDPDRNGRSSEVVEQRADGTGDVELLASFDGNGYFVPTSWSPDGALLALTMAPVRGAADRLSAGSGRIAVVTVGSPDSFRLLSVGEPAWAPAISPDGRWLAYMSRATGITQVYVERFPEGGDRQAVSIGGGRFPKWSADGRSITYLRHEREGPSLAMMRAPISGGRRAGEPLKVGAATELFPWSFYEGVDSWRFFDMTPDGERFLVLSLGGSDVANRAILSQNWARDLLARVPTN